MSSEDANRYPEQRNSVVRPKVFSSWNPAFTFPNLFGAELLLWHLVFLSAVFMEFKRCLMLLGCADNKKLLKELA